MMIIKKSVEVFFLFPFSFLIKTEQILSQGIIQILCSAISELDVPFFLLSQQLHGFSRQRLPAAHFYAFRTISE